MANGDHDLEHDDLDTAICSTRSTSVRTWARLWAEGETAYCNIVSGQKLAAPPQTASIFHNLLILRRRAQGEQGRQERDSHKEMQCCCFRGSASAESKDGKRWHAE